MKRIGNNITSWTKWLAGALALLFALGVQAKPVQLNLELGQDLLPANTKHTSYIRIGLEGLPLPSREVRAPINVALVLDRSGSMQGEKLRHAKQAAIMALDYLRSDDTLSVVVYDDMVSVLVPATTLHNKGQVRRAIQSIEPRGRTALFAGVSKGAAELRKYVEENRVNRVILLSDGLANVGPSTPSELGRLGRRLGGQGISVTTIGLGLGYNEDLMVRLAGASDGNHVFAETPSELAQVFRNEFGDLASIIAQDVIIIINCGDGVRPLRMLGRDAEIRGNRVEARLNQLYAEQEKYLLLEIETPAGRSGEALDLASVEVSYNDLIAKQRDKLSGQAQARYSASAAETERSMNKKVLVSASEQIGAEMDDEALELKAKGDVQGASAVFRRKAEYLDQEADKLGSQKLREQSEMSREAEEAVAAPAASPTWSKQRKALRADQYSIQNQQSYK
jgi:Ca-activated chloride channel family protein